MWYVYIIICKDRSLYTGLTNDLNRRIIEHSNNQGSRHIRINGFDKLIYYEEFESRLEGVRRERKIKKFERKEKDHLIKFGTGTRL